MRGRIEEDKATYTDPYLPILRAGRSSTASHNMLENQIIVVVAFYVRDTVNFPFNNFFYLCAPMPIVTFDCITKSSTQQRLLIDLQLRRHILENMLHSTI